MNQQFNDKRVNPHYYEVSETTNEGVDCYPMMSWPHMTRCYMVFGHIHGNTDADYWPLIRENDLMLNAGADVNGFAPVTFEEMQENNYRHKAGWNPELCTMEADQ